MQIDRLSADGEDGNVYEVVRVWATTAFKPQTGPVQHLKGSYEYRLASGEDLETVDDAKRQYRTWNGGILITLRPE